MINGGVGTISGSYDAIRRASRTCGHERLMVSPSWPALPALRSHAGQKHPGQRGIAASWLGKV
jgi:hypothetical protein